VISTATSNPRVEFEQATATQPSPRQIRQHMAQIRQSWSPDERALRASHHRLRLQRLAVALMLSSVAPLTCAE